MWSSAFLIFFQEKGKTIGMWRREKEEESTRNHEGLTVLFDVEGPVWAFGTVGVALAKPASLPLFLSFAT